MKIELKIQEKSLEKIFLKEKKRTGPIPFLKISTRAHVVYSKPGLP